MTEESMNYGGYTIIKDEHDRFFVVAEDLFTGRLYQRSLEEAKKFIDYINNKRSSWVC